MDRLDLGNEEILLRGLNQSGNTDRQQHAELCWETIPRKASDSPGQPGRTKFVPPQSTAGGPPKNTAAA